MEGPIPCSLDRQKDLGGGFKLNLDQEGQLDSFREMTTPNPKLLLSQHEVRERISVGRLCQVRGRRDTSGINNVRMTNGQMGGLLGRQMAQRTRNGSLPCLVL